MKDDIYLRLYCSTGALQIHCDPAGNDDDHDAAAAAIVVLYYTMEILENNIDQIRRAILASIKS